MRLITTSLIIVFVSVGSLIMMGLRFNTTASVPVGFYKLTVISPRQGDLVLCCPPATAIVQDAQVRGYLGVGHCAYGAGYLIKKVVALKGDSVSINDDGVTVNEKLIVNSQPLSTDRQGRALTPYILHNYRLKADELFVLSDYSPYSFDGRYFGLLTQDNVCGVLTPLWVW